MQNEIKEDWQNSRIIADCLAQEIEQARRRRFPSAVELLGTPGDSNDADTLIRSCNSFTAQDILDSCAEVH